MMLNEQQCYIHLATMFNIVEPQRRKLEQAISQLKTEGAKE